MTDIATTVNTEPVHKKIKLSRICMIIIAAALMISKCLDFGIRDNDIYGHLSNGRYILVHGVPLTDVWSYYPQQRSISTWLYDILMYGLYDLFKTPGLIIFMGITMSFFAWTSVMLLKELGKKDTLTSFVFIVFAEAIFFFYNGLRPELMTDALLTMQCFFCERYINTGHKRWLYMTPLAVWLEVNCHGYLTPLHFIILIPYMIYIPIKNTDIPVLKDKFIQRYIGIKKLILPVIISVTAMFATPMKQYILFDLGEALRGGTGKSQQYISELHPLGFGDLSVMLIWLLLFTCVLLLILFQKRIAVSSLFMMFGFLALCATKLKQIGFVFPFITYLYGCSTINFYPDIDKIFSRKVLCTVSAVCVGIFSCIGIYNFHKSQILFSPKDTVSTPVKAVSWLEHNDSRKDIHILNGHQDGSFLNFYGYKPLVDYHNLLTDRVNGRYVSDMDGLRAFYCNTDPGVEDYNKYLKKHKLSYKELYDHILKKYKADYILVPNDENLLTYNLKQDDQFAVAYRNKKYILYKWS